MECIEYIRKLTEWGVRVRFDKEGIDTGEEYSEMLLTVLAAFAAGGEPFPFRKCEMGETETGAAGEYAPAPGIRIL